MLEGLGNMKQTIFVALLMAVLVLILLESYYLFYSVPSDTETLPKLVDIPGDEDFTTNAQNYQDQHPWLKQGYNFVTSKTIPICTCQHPYAGWLDSILKLIGLPVSKPTCANIPKLEWWQTSVFYQIYPRSFQDSNSDGVGDLKGIESRLDYLVDLGIKAVWINPIFTSPMKDFGYDVSNYTDIDRTFGTMKDFDRLLKKLHKKGIRLVLDLIPNHSSDQHVWFQESRKSKSRDDYYRNYYVWVNCQEGKPPNNWLSVWGASTWSYDPVRKQCYFHQYNNFMPDLNIRNSKVQQELEKIIRFWMDKGLDGLRLDAISRMFEDIDLRNESPSGKTKNKINFHYLHHNYTNSLPEVYDMVFRWRRILDEYTRKDGKYRFMVAEANVPIEDQVQYYGRDQGSGADFPFNFNMLKLNRTCGGDCVYRLVDRWLLNTPKFGWPNWEIGNHDQKRVANKMGENFVNALNILILLLPGTPTTYYGEELGMNNIIVEPNQIIDPGGRLFPKKTRDVCRSPMQWNDEDHAGFSNATETWLPVNPNYSQKNTQVQQVDVNSPLNVYKSVTRLRQEFAFLYGNMNYELVDNNIFSFSRIVEGCYTSYVIAINFGSERVTANLQVSSRLPELAEVVETTRNGVKYAFGDMVSLRAVELKPGEGIVFKWATEQ